MNAKSKKVINLICVLVLLVTITGCTSVQTKKTNVIIEVNASPQIIFHNVVVNSNGSLVTVAGTLHKRSHGRTIIPGHIDITFFSPNGDVLHELETKYYRPSYKSRDSIFNVDVPIELADGSTVRINHYRTSKH